MPDGTQFPRATSTALLTLPNVITFGRLCAVPLAVWLVLQQMMSEAFFLFLVAGLSDAVDGWLARRGGGSVLGALLDPVADKALLVSMYVTLAAVHVLPDWLAILVVFRDIVIVGGVLLLFVLGQTVPIRPLYVSKANTALQITLVALALLHSFLSPGLPFLPDVLILDVLVWAVAATTLISGGAYVWNAVRGR
jgi:cardiolipin synthase